MRLVIDSIRFADINEYEWPHKIGYINGRISAWTPDQIETARRKGQLLALVDVLGTAPHQAAVLDFERGDVQDPAALLKWVIIRNEFRNDAVVYCNRSSLPTVIQALRGVPWRLWLADPTENGEPPMTPPKNIVLPANAKLLGIQYVLTPHSGGNYDMSIFYDDFWHATRDSAAEVLAEQGLAEHPPAAARAEADGAQVITVDPQDADHPSEPAAAAPSAPPAISATSPSSSALPRPVAAGALSRSSASASVIASAPSPSLTASPSARIPTGPDQGTEASTPAERPDNLQAADVDQPAAEPSYEARADEARANQGITEYHDQDRAHWDASVQQAVQATQADPGRLPHAWMARALADARQVAKLMHDAGATQVAELLEQATRHADEIGRLLQMAGQ